MTNIRLTQDLLAQLADPERRRFLESLILKAQQAPSKSKARDDAIYELLKACNFNPALLVPEYWPRYPFDQPISFRTRPYQITLLEVVHGLESCIRAGRQIGKSTVIAIRQLLLTQILSTFRTLYVCPHPEHLKSQQNRTAELQRACTLFRKQGNDRKKGLRVNLSYKEWPNGSVAQLIRVLGDAVDSRGKTTDEILWDEYQLFDIDLQVEVAQTMRTSRVPVNIFSGTSTTIDSPLEAAYVGGSMSTWHVKVSTPGKPFRWVDFGEPEFLLKVMTETGLRDPETGTLLDVTDGTFVHQDRKAFEELRRSYHVPQLIVSDFVTRPFKYREIYNDRLKYTEQKFLQEICGIPSAEAEREITRKDLEDICNPDWSIQTMLQRVKKRTYRFIISGIDWGGSDYNPVSRTKTSFTVHVIVGVTQQGDFDILHMRQYSGMHYEEIASSIVATWRDFTGVAMGSDFGGGAAYNQLLRQLGIPVQGHLILAYSAPNSAPLGIPAGFRLPNQFSLNRTDSISTLFAAIKSGRIRCYQWKEAQERLLEILNLHRIPNEGPNGQGGFLYQRNPRKSDDTLHALNFAYVVGRLMLGEPLVVDPSVGLELRNGLLQGRVGPFGGFGSPVSG